MVSDYLSSLFPISPCSGMWILARPDSSSRAARLVFRSDYDALITIVTVHKNNIHLPTGDEAVADQVGGADKQGVGRVWILGN